MNKTMFERLKDDASEGADLSPGDPVAAWAVEEIERLTRERDEYAAGYALQREYVDRLTRELAEARLERDGAIMAAQEPRADDVVVTQGPEELFTEIERLTRENSWLRAYTGQSAKECIYCRLGAAEQAQCKSGFPGCARGDDQMLCREVGVGLERDRLRAALNRYGQHDDDCSCWNTDPPGPQCGCGFAEITAQGAGTPCYQDEPRGE